MVGETEVKAAICLIATLALAVACQGTFEERELVGYYEDDLHRETLTLMTGGQYEETIHYNNGQVFQNAGKWSLVQGGEGSKVLLRSSILEGYYQTAGPEPRPTPLVGDFRLDARQLFGTLTLTWDDGPVLTRRHP
ncbi:MAG: hypothetical protein QOF51_296 [Chloroflexota bacterium]|jgi:hypothetical protein|nr:hypothetical protein [Chloroflexota bacterium]